MGLPGLLKSCFSPGQARKRACFLKVWKVFARQLARKNLPHFHMSAPQARRKQSHSDFREALTDYQFQLRIADR